MNRIAVDSRRRGFSLVELMVALLLSLCLAAAAVLVFRMTGDIASAVSGAARVQDAARFGLALVAEDAREAGTATCLNFQPSAPAAGAVAPVEPRAPLVAYFDASAAPFHLGAPPAAAAYAVDPKRMIRGFECGALGCNPAVTELASLGGGLAPDEGTAFGQRLLLSDMLLLRYWPHESVAVTAVRDGGADGAPAKIDLAQPAATVGLDGAGVALVADCSTQALVRVHGDGTTLTLTGNFDNDRLPGLDLQQARVVAATAGPITTVYYLSSSMRTAEGSARTGVLVRRANGRDEPVANGIRRLDFLYAIELADGRTVIVDANEAQLLDSCRPLAAPGAGEIGCGWRGLKGLEIHLLAESATRVRAADQRAYRYPFALDGSAAAADAYQSVADLGIAQGLPADATLLRHFSTFIALRGLNP